MQIMIAAFGQETNTFSPDRIGIREFMPNGWQKAQGILEKYRGTGSYLGGAIRACEEAGAAIVPLDSTQIDGGPMMNAACVEECVGHLCDQVAQHRQSCDGLFVAMHGAGSAEGVEDLEAYTLKKLRAVVGDSYPITVSLDIHGNVTPEMIELADGLFSIKEYPHTDMAEAGYLAVKTMVEMIRTGKKPVVNWVSLPIILPNTTTTTLDVPMARVRDHFAQVCREKGLIDATLVQGFSANDQYWAGASVLVVAWEDASDTAKELARYFWQRRHEFDPHPQTATQALDTAQAFEGPGYALIHESSDNPGSGCPGDGTHLLRELIERNLPGTLFMFVYDPETARQAHDAGVGARLRVRIGGKTAPVCGEPVECDAEVLALADGHFRYVTPQNFGVAVSIGLTARLKVGNVEVVVASYRTQSFDDRPLAITGADIRDYRIVCIKSAGHFRAYFKDRAGCIIPCEMPGLRSTNLRSYPYKNIRRPIYPLDDHINFE